MRCARRPTAGKRPRSSLRAACRTACSGSDARSTSASPEAEKAWAHRVRPLIHATRSYGPVDSGRQFGRIQPLTSTREATMSASALGPAQAAIQVDLAAVFVSLELSRSAWLITSLPPGGGERMSKHPVRGGVRGGDVAGLLDQLARLRVKAQARTGKTFPIIVIQEAGLDGFWIRRVLEREGIGSHVVDAA